MWASSQPRATNVAPNLAAPQGVPQTWASSQPRAKNVAPNLAATQGVAPKCGPLPSQWKQMCFEMWQRFSGRLPNVGLSPVSGNMCFEMWQQIRGGSQMRASSQLVINHIDRHVVLHAWSRSRVDCVVVVIVLRAINGASCSNRTCSGQSYVAVSIVR